MKRLYIVTAEPSNFVPKALKKAGDELGLDAHIIDLTHVVLIEGMGKDGVHDSGIFCVKKPKEGEEGETSITKLEVCEETMVIPRLNEYHLDVKLSVLKRMESLGATLLNTPESMALCNDKLMTHVVLNNAGIKSPFSFTMTNVDDIEATVDWLEKEGLLKYPIVIKTLRGTHGIGVMKLDSRASLVSVAQTLQKENMDFIVQEFMEHDQSARMIMIGDKLLAANLRGQPKDKGEFRTNSHLGSETEPYTPSEDEVALGARIVELFGSKFCAIDYLVRENGSIKEIIILEVNGSPGLENIQKNWPDRDLAKDVVQTACNCGADQTVATMTDPLAQGPVEPQDVVPEPTPLPDDVVQEVEMVIVHRVIDETEARIDTGAKYSSIHADKVTFDENWTKFTRGDVTFKVNTDRFIKIKNVHGGESIRRPMIRLDVTIKGKRFNGIEFTVNDRAHMKYQVLIGRNILEQLGLPVIVPQSDDPQSIGAPESEIFTVEEE